MPAPDHLLPILDHVLGDGGTVALAERIHQYTTDQMAAAVAAAVPPDAAVVQDELAEMRRNYEGACRTVALMHAAAVGETRGPIRGVVEDVEDLRTAFLNAEARADRALEKLAEVAGQDAVTAAYALPEMEAAGPGLLPDLPDSAYPPGATPLPEPEVDVRPDIRELIEASSLGEPDAVAARARVSDEQAAAVVARAAELAGQDDEGDDIDWDDATDQIGDVARALAAAQDTGLDEFAADTTHNPTPPDGDTDGPAPARPGPTAEEIRTWCLANGVPVAAKGRINAAARAAYDTAHGAA